MTTHLFRNCLAIISAVVLTSMSGTGLAQLNPLPQLPKPGFTPKTPPSNADLLPPGTPKPPAPKPLTPPPQPPQPGKSVGNRVPVNKNPVISQLSRNVLQPGDEVVITGSGFGGEWGGMNGVNQVVFSVGSNRNAFGADSSGDVLEWSDSRIRVKLVSQISGFPDCDGQVYVQRGYEGQNGSVKSEGFPFRFKPAMQTIKPVVPFGGDWMADARIQPGYDKNANGIKRSFGVIGGKGDDEFWLSKKLINGYTVQSVRLIGQGVGGNDNPDISGHANATIAEFRQGSNSPYVKVHWWGDAFSSVAYKVEVTVIGPRGMPSGL